jgi:hypothetical protein
MYTKILWSFLTVVFDPLNILYDGYLVSFPGVMRPGRGFDHFCPSSTGVVYRYNYMFTVSLCLNCVFWVDLYPYINVYVFLRRHCVIGSFKISVYFIVVSNNLILYVFF